MSVPYIGSYTNICESSVEAFGCAAARRRFSACKSESAGSTNLKPISPITIFFPAGTSLR